MFSISTSQNQASTRALSPTSLPGSLGVAKAELAWSRIASVIRFSSEGNRPVKHSGYQEKKGIRAGEKAGQQDRRIC